jgi:hypothetical protein
VSQANVIRNVEFDAPQYGVTFSQSASHKTDFGEALGRGQFDNSRSERRLHHLSQCPFGSFIVASHVRQMADVYVGSGSVCL